MTTTEYLKQRGIELLDFFGIKPTSSLVIKTLRGEVLTIEHRLPKAEEKEFIEEFLQGKPSIPAVQIERVQFPNDLNGTEAADLEHKVRIDQAYYERKQEYVFETNFGLSFSREDWNRQCWRSKTYDSDKSEYLIAVRDKSTPDRKIIGHSTHSSEKEIEAIQGSFSKYKDIDSKDTAIETYIIFNSNDPEYKKAKTENLERYLDDPRNKVSLINVIDIPETVLIYSNENNIHKLYSGNNIFQDFYNENYNKPGTASVCTTDALHMLSDCIKYKIPLKEIDFMKIENQFFAPELNYYIHSRISNNMDIDKRNLYDDTVNNEVKLCYTDYRAFLKEHNLSDIPRDLSFINEAVMYNPSTLEILTDKEKQSINWQDLLESSMESPLKHMPKELITFDLLYKANYYEPEMIYKHLPSSFSNEQIVKLIEKSYRSENSIDNNGRKLTVLINALPNDLKNKGLVSELHKQFDKTYLLKELAYSLIVLDLEKNNKNAINAIEHFKNSRFIIDYDPCGFDNSWGQVCGGEYYTNSNMLNPADKFEPDLLTIKQWHDIASQDTRMLEFIPESIIKEETFWENYQEFIGKGGYLNNPDNEYCMEKFDEYQVFDKMPEHLKTNPDICLDLLEKKAISLSFIKNPTEEHYLLVNPQDYDRIPLDLREKDSFKDLALKAFSIEKWNILNIPEKFITQEMVSEALSHDMELCNRIPIHYLSEELLCNKIKNYKHQGAFSEINRSGEHPQYIEYELSNHKKVLQYVPEELKTDLVCQAALKANPENAAFLPQNHYTNEEKELVSTQKAEVSNKAFPEKLKTDQEKDYLIDKFDVHEVISKMPEDLKNNPNIFYDYLQSQQYNPIQKLQLTELANTESPISKMRLNIKSFVKPNFSQFPFSEMPLDIKQSVTNLIESHEKVTKDYFTIRNKVSPYIIKDYVLKDGLIVLHDSIANLEKIKESFLNRINKNNKAQQADKQELPLIKFNSKFEKYSDLLPKDLEAKLSEDKEFLSSKVEEDKRILENKYDFHRVENVEEFNDLCKEIIYQKAAMNILNNRIEENNDCAIRIERESPSRKDYSNINNELKTTFIKNILPLFKNLEFKTDEKIFINNDYTFFFQSQKHDSNVEISNLSNELSSDMSYSLKQDVMFLASNFHGCQIKQSCLNENNLLRTVSSEALELFKTSDIYKSINLSYKSEIESELLLRRNNTPELKVGHTDNKKELEKQKNDRNSSEIRRTGMENRNILHPKRKKELSNSNRISKSSINNRDSNRRRKGPKL